MWKLTLVVGIGIGYVLGAKAGRQRYEQIAGAARQFADSPVVQDVAEKAKQQAGAVVERAAAAVSDRVGDRLPTSLIDRVPLFHRHTAPDDSWGTYRP